MLLTKIRPNTTEMYMHVGHNSALHIKGNIPGKLTGNVHDTWYIVYQTQQPKSLAQRPNHTHTRTHTHIQLADLETAA